MRNMKTICAIRDVFRAMTNFEASFEQVYQLFGKNDGNKPVETNRFEPFPYIKNAPDTGRKRTDRQNFGKRGPAANVLYPVCCRKRTGL